MTLRRVPASVRSRLALSSERGSMLVEVMVGAVVLAIATFAILDGLDGAQATGAKNKARSVQSSLAQQDIERLRSIPVKALSNLRQTRLVEVAGVTYTVASRTDWVRDSTGVVTCASDSTQASYLKLSTTVTGPTGDGRPVKETGLLTPSIGQLNEDAGSATVKVTDRDGRPQVGVTVNLAGPASYSDRTNELGCVVFGYIPGGTYTASVPGMVTKDSNGTAAEPLPVYAGQTSLGQIEAERAASLRATFVPPAGQTLPATPLANEIWVKNSGLPGTRKGFTGPNAGSLEAGGLFPFLDGVAVHAGSCTANDPSSYAGQGAYFQNAAKRGFTELDPGDLLRGVEVEMPSVRVSVDTQSGNWRLAQLNLKPTVAGCDDTVTLQQANKGASNGNAVTFDFSLPFGAYEICAATSTGTNWTSGTRRRYSTVTDLTGLLATPPAHLNLTKAPAQANRAVTIATPTTGTNQVCAA